MNAETLMDQTQAAKDYIAGCIGGIAGIIVGHPFDTVKVRLQMQGSVGVEARYRGMIHCFFDIVKTESLAGLYKGVLAPIVSAGLINATVFGVHGHVMERLQPDSRVPRLTNSFIAGSAGGFVSSFITCPTELIRIRMQMQGIGEREVFLEYTGHHSAPGAHKYYDSTWDCFKKVAKSEGVTGLYRGNITTILRETPSFGFYFVSMDYFCHQSAKYFDVHFDEVGPVTLFIGGGFSGMICWLISYPFDVVKSRLQCDGVERTEYKGTIDCFRKTYNSAGIHGFFKGITPTLVRAFPVNATTWITAIMIKRLLSRQDL